MSHSWIILAYLIFCRIFLYKQSRDKTNREKLWIPDKKYFMQPSPLLPLTCLSNEHFLTLLSYQIIFTLFQMLFFFFPIQYLQKDYWEIGSDWLFFLRGDFKLGQYLGLTYLYDCQGVGVESPPALSVYNNKGQWNSEAMTSFEQVELWN